MRIVSIKSVSMTKRDAFGWAVFAVTTFAVGAIGVAFVGMAVGVPAVGVGYVARLIAKGVCEDFETVAKSVTIAKPVKDLFYQSANKLANLF